MNKLFLSGFVALFLLAGFAVRADDSTNAQAVAIAAVFHKRQELVKTFNLATPRERMRALKIYKHALLNISTKGCPKDFRLAWFDYCTACTESPFNPVFEEAAKVEADFIALRTGSKLAADAASKVEVHTPLFYWQQVKRIAVAYGAL